MKAKEALRILTSEKCPVCRGAGVLPIERVEPACCGNLLYTGECCGQAVPHVEIEWEGCSFCGTKGTVKAQR